MPGASAADAGRAENARGTAYELHAIQEDTKRNEPGRRTWFGDRVPPYLVQFVRGEPLTIRGFHKTLRWLRERETERVRLGRSPQLGMDGVSAMYVSHHLMYTNATQARNALAKLLTAASAYLRAVSVPAFDAIDSQAERCRVLTAGERVTDHSITQRSVALQRAPLTAPISSSGWWNEGGRRH